MGAAQRPLASSLSGVMTAAPDDGAVFRPAVVGMDSRHRSGGSRAGLSGAAVRSGSARQTALPRAGAEVRESLERATGVSSAEKAF